MLRVEKKNLYRVLGVEISPYTKNEFFGLIRKRLQDDDPASPPFFVVTVNPEIAIQSIIDNEFKEILNSSSINTADGIGIRWAVNFLYGKEVDRITGSDSLERICRICAYCREPVFFYGAMPGIARKAADILQERLHDLSVAGSYSPEQADVPFEDLPPVIQRQLKEASVTFVGLGAPAQEKWIHENLPRLPRCKLIIGVGGSFDFITGNVKRAPDLFRRLGLEWIYRLYAQPSRWRRMLKLPLFALNVILLKSSNRDIQSIPKS